jgi:hypothetical protein
MWIRQDFFSFLIEDAIFTKFRPKVLFRGKKLQPITPCVPKPGGPSKSLVKNTRPSHIARSYYASRIHTKKRQTAHHSIKSVIELFHLRPLLSEGHFSFRNLKATLVLSKIEISATHGPKIPRHRTSGPGHGFPEP